jgi:phage tail sheath protein FI
MPISNYRTPAIYMEEVQTGPRPIQAVGTNTAAFVGQAPDPKAHLGEAIAVNNWSQFVREFVPLEGGHSTELSNAVAGFFMNGGHRCYVVNHPDAEAIVGSDRPRRTGLKLLETIEDISIVTAPGRADAASYDALISHAENMRYRMAIIDPPKDVPNTDLLKTAAEAPAPTQPARNGGKEGAEAPRTPAPTGLRPRTSQNGYAAFYFPSLVIADPLSPKGDLTICPPSGHMAGIWARTDATRGVHKAPANETVRGALNITYRVTHEEQADLNSRGVNCIRSFPSGILVWGARTNADEASPWRYLNVRRLFIMVEQSIVNSTNWIIFEPNKEELWGQVRRDVGAFLRTVWRDGALVGRTPEEAFFVKCDRETNPDEMVDQGILVTLIGLAPVKPAEFVVFRIGQQAGGATVEMLS